MLRLLTLVGLLLSMLSCHKDVDAQEKAALIAVQDFATCGGCGGWVVIAL